MVHHGMHDVNIPDSTYMNILLNFTRPGRRRGLTALDVRKELVGTQDLLCWLSDANTLSIKHIIHSPLFTSAQGSLFG